MQESQRTLDPEDFTDSYEKELFERAKYACFNVNAPINTLGYGLYAAGFANSLCTLNNNIALIAMNNSNYTESMPFKHGVHVTNQYRHDYDTKPIQVWHLRKQDFSVSNPSLITFFETDTLSKEEIDSIGSVRSLIVPSQWAVDILKKYTDKPVYKIHGPCNSINLWDIERGSNKSWNLIIGKIRSVCGAKGPTFFSSGKWEVRKSHHEIIDAITATQLPITLVGAWFNVFLGIEPIYKYLTTHGWEIQITGSFQEGTATIFKNKYDAKIVVLPRVKLTSDYLGIMSSCDIHLGLSKGEGWDMPAVEAMGMGLPVILSKNTAHLEYLYESELNSANLVLPAKDVISHTFIDCEETVANDGIWFFNKGNWYTPVQSQVVKSIAWWFNNYSDELRNDVGFEAFRVINKVTSPRRILLDTFKAVETK